MTDLSIIIVCYRGWERLTKCLEALDAFTGIKYTTEVIVVDNRSDDETIKKIEGKFTKFRFIYNQVNGGYANGCNLGGRNATGEFILILNPDTVVSESELEKLLDIARNNPSYGIVSCRQVNENGKESIASGPFPMFRNLTGFQRAIFHPTLHTPQTASRTPHTAPRTPELSFPDWVSGSVIMMRNELYRKLNGFDEDFWMYFEDVDICKRVRDTGGEVVLCNNVTIEHNHGGSSRINVRTTSLTKTEVHISKHVYISKHKTGFNRFLIQAFLVINNLISGGLMALAGLILFFVPKVFARTLIFLRLLKYYLLSAVRLSWISPMSVNYHKK